STSSPERRAPVDDRGPEPHRPVRIERWSPDGHETADDLVVAEEPLQVVLDGDPFAVIMRTPGHDLELVLGLLFVEGLIRALTDVAGAAVAASGLPVEAPPFPVLALPEAENLVDLRLARPRPKDGPVGWQRNLVSNSACGICGAAALDALRADLAMLPSGPAFARTVISGMAPALRDVQATFDLTGGLHAAGLFDREGRLLAAREDVGRHNAVDKLVGRALLAGELPLHDRALMVSGRASFELAQKAVAAGIPLMAAVSAPSSLAVHVAHTFGLTLVGFLRGDRFNVYAAGERIA
ncbi:MAG: formate dehydrogenase family accessory protein FdhD, partial [Chloroflexi bacterium CSP1-4]